MTYQFNRIIILKLLGTLCRVLEIQMSITKKPDGWVVYDDAGRHLFDTEEEAKKWLAGTPEKKEEPKVEKEEK